MLVVNSDGVKTGSGSGPKLQKGDYRVCIKRNVYALDWGCLPEEVAPARKFAGVRGVCVVGVSGGCEGGAGVGMVWDRVRKT